MSNNLFTPETFRESLSANAPADDELILNIVRRFYALDVKTLMTSIRGNWKADPVKKYMLPRFSRDYSEEWENGVMTFAELHCEYQRLCDELFKHDYKDYSKLIDTDYALALTANGHSPEKYKFALK